jgi:hypothetical protein
MRFDFSIEHVPGKKLHTPDAISRAPLEETSMEGDILNDEMEHYVKAVFSRSR